MSLCVAIAGAVFEPVTSVAPPQPPLCPLVAAAGNYTVASGNAIFAPDMAAALGRAILSLNAQAIIPQINSGFRTASGQGALGNAGGITPAAPGQSRHEVGMAVDIQINRFGEWTIDCKSQAIVNAMTAGGLTWGGTFTDVDRVHFQLPGSVTRNQGTLHAALQLPLAALAVLKLQIAVASIQTEPNSL